ncbi:MAG: hypothetical protein JOZ75_04430 [Candidatus Dormibacteraeota bacterium]|nr:hypothetical protein [Candidatus Dormibacteraeota bacterium]
MTDEEPTPDEKPKHGLGERIREHLQAAEVAAEESAGYGWVTEAVEAVEAAVNPMHELGPQKHDDGPEDSDASPEQAPSAEAGDAAAQG